MEGAYSKDERCVSFLSVPHHLYFPFLGAVLRVVESTIVAMGRFVFVWGGKHPWRWVGKVLWGKNQPWSIC